MQINNMAKKTKSNRKGSGRYPMFKKEFGKSKRISITIPDKRETEIKEQIEAVLMPYLY